MSASPKDALACVGGTPAPDAMALPETLMAALTQRVLAQLQMAGAVPAPGAIIEAQVVSPPPPPPPRKHPRMEDRGDGHLFGCGNDQQSEAYQEWLAELCPGDAVVLCSKRGRADQDDLHAMARELEVAVPHRDLVDRYVIGRLVHATSEAWVVDMRRGVRDWVLHPELFSRTTGWALRELKVGSYARGAYQIVRPFAGIILSAVLEGICDGIESALIRSTQARWGLSALEDACCGYNEKRHARLHGQRPLDVLPVPTALAALDRVEEHLATLLDEMAAVVAMTQGEDPMPEAAPAEAPAEAGTALATRPARALAKGAP